MLVHGHRRPAEALSQASMCLARMNSQGGCQHPAPSTIPVEGPHGFSGHQRGLFEDVTRFIDRLHSSHFNSCVVGLVRAGVRRSRPNPYPSDPSAATPLWAIRMRNGVALSMQIAIEQLDIRQIIESSSVSSSGTSTPRKHPAEPRRRFPLSV
jgi:hypothetical protein